jgi:hypothetical protein
LRDVEVDHADRGIDVVGQRPAPGGELEREALSHGARVRVLRRAGPWVAIGGAVVTASATASATEAKARGGVTGR